MSIASSIFDSIHSRPASAYNRASVELALCILFDQKLSIPTPSIIDSPLFLGVFGEFLKVQVDPRYAKITPFELCVDPDRHFDLSASSHVIYQAMDAYLSGRAQTGKDLSQDPEFAKLTPRFAFIDKKFIEDLGRGNLAILARNRDSNILEMTPPYIRDNIHLVERYFLNNPSEVKQISNVFNKNTYDELLSKNLDKYVEYLREFGIGDFSEQINEMSSELRSRNAFTRNQIFSLGESTVGGDWDKYFVPMINHHYWEIMKKVCKAKHSVNELAEAAGQDVFSGISYSMDTFPTQIMSNVKFAGDTKAEVDDSDGYFSPYRFRFDWKAIMDIRQSPETESHLKAMKAAERRSTRESAADKYLEFLSKNLGRLVDIDRDEYGTFTVKATSTRRNYPARVVMMRRVIPIASSLIGNSISAAVGGIAGYSIGGAWGGVAGATVLPAVANDVTQKIMNETIGSRILSNQDLKYDKKQWRKLIKLETLTS